MNENSQNAPPSDPNAPRRKVFVTGASGRIGSRFCAAYRDLYDLTMLVAPGDHRPLAPIEGCGEMVTGDISSAERLTEQLAGMDTVLHLAANGSYKAPWPSLLENNILGTYNVFTAAMAAGCRRVVFSSSIHAMSGYPLDYQIKTSDPVNPGSVYGVTKCFGEALARWMAGNSDTSAVVLRIGAWEVTHTRQNNPNVDVRSVYISSRDLNQILRQAIDAPDIKFAIVHAIGDCAFKRLDLSDTHDLLGYTPVDDSSHIVDENV